MVLGVTGGIAAGKSTVTETLRSLGAAVLSADQLARDAVCPGSETLTRLVDRFGSAILNSRGELDRPVLAEKVFSDPQARADLNAIMHPAIAALAQGELSRLKKQNPPLIVYEAPLLFEVGAQDRVDAVLVVTVGEDVQLERLKARDGLDQEGAQARVAAQMPQAQKVALADYVIDNSGSREKTIREVTSLFKTLVAS